MEPTQEPTQEPTSEPVERPTSEPTLEPTFNEQSPAPTMEPTDLESTEDMFNILAFSTMDLETTSSSTTSSTTEFELTTSGVFQLELWRAFAMTAVVGMVLV